MMEIGKMMAKTSPVVQLTKLKESMLIQTKPRRKSRRRRLRRPNRPQTTSWLTRLTFPCRLVRTLILEKRETIELRVMTITVLSRPM